MVSHHSDVYCSGTAVAVSEGSVAVGVCKQEPAIEVTKNGVLGYSGTTAVAATVVPRPL